MDKRTGKIYEIESDEYKNSLERQLGTKLHELTEVGFNAVYNLDEEKRPEELSVIEFKNKRKNLKAPYNLHIENAYRLGYQAGKKDSK